MKFRKNQIFFTEINKNLSNLAINHRAQNVNSLVGSANGQEWIRVCSKEI